MNFTGEAVDHDFAGVFFEANDDSAPLFVDDLIFVTLSGKVVPKLIDVIVDRCPAAYFNHLGIQSTLLFFEILLHIEQLKEELISRFIILFLVNVLHLVFLILKFNLKAVDPAYPVLLLDEISEVNWAQSHVLKLAHLLLSDS